MLPALRSAAGLAAAALLLAACGGGTPGETVDAEGMAEAPALSAAEIRVYLSDATLTTLWDDAVQLEYFAPDGRLEGYWRTPSLSSGRGRGSWEVQEDGLLCRFWDEGWTGPLEDCVEVRRLGDAYLLAPPGSAASEAVRALRSPGNDTANKT